MDTQTQIERLIELAIVQRTELKELVAQLPQLREHLNAEVEKAFEEAEPQLRSELEEWTTKQAQDKTAALGVTLETKIAELAKNLEISTQARYNAIIAEREENARLAAQAEQKIAEHAASLPGAVKEIVTAELARFPRAGEIDQLRKEFAEPKSLNPRGKWLPSETYNKLDLVTFNGDSYVSNTDGNRERPSRNAANWTLSAARGMGGGTGFTSLNNVLGDPSAGQIVGSQNGQYVPKTLVAGANITINETASAITIIGDEGQISLQDGTAAAPSLFFTNDTDTGLYRPAANTLGISVSGTQVAYFDENGLTVPSAGVVAGGSIHASNGNANNPSLSFSNDQDTGFFRHQPNELGITLGGTQYATLTSTTFTITPNLVVTGTGTINGTSIPASKTLVVTTDKLSALASTSSSELAGVITDETGTGSLVFANTPTLVTPNIGAATGTSLTTTGNLTAADLILGTSGPSVKSTLSARAPRQGLVFDGTAGATVASVAVIGTADFSYTAWINQPTAGNADIISGAYNVPGLYVTSTGIVGMNDVGVAGVISSSAGAYAAGKTSFITYTRSGTTATIYVNGISVASGTDSRNYASAPTSIGSRNGSQLFLGSIVPSIYNRALSAAEVVALYEAGAPAGADYSAIPASNTNQASTLTADVGSPTVSGNQVTFSGSSQRVRSAQFSYRSGNKILITAVVSGFSGTAFQYYMAGGAIGTWTANGTYNVTISDGSAGTNAVYVQNSGGAATGTVTLTITALGLLLAPDAAQAGGGLVWYDTSGNAANITLPASGVSWNVPSSGNIAANANQNVTITTSGTGRLVVPKESSASNDYTAVFGTSLASSTGSGRVKVVLGNTDGNCELSVGQSGSNNAILGWAYNATASDAYAFLSSYAGSNKLVLQGDGGNVLLGTTTDGGQKLQVAGTGYFTGNVNVYKTSGEAALQADYSTTYVKIFNDSSSLGLYSNSWGGLLTFTKSTEATTVEGKSIALKPNGTTALTLDSSQRCILAGALRLNNAYTAGAPTATGYVTIEDSAGNSYKVLVGT